VAIITTLACYFAYCTPYTDPPLASDLNINFLKDLYQFYERSSENTPLGLDEVNHSNLAPSHMGAHGIFATPFNAPFREIVLMVICVNTKERGKETYKKIIKFWRVLDFPYVHTCVWV
jgi:hypothetical protein